MGSFYTIGVTKNFIATSNEHLTIDEWRSVLNDRLDLECFSLTMDENELKGKLDESIFTDQIADFYQSQSRVPHPQGTM